jgi:hypothetical protein
MTQADLERAARQYEDAAAELERAIGHCRVAAERFRSREQASGTAHAWAARGHLLVAGELLDEQAREHRARALLPGDEGFR